MEQLILVYRITKDLFPVMEIHKKIDPVKDIKLWSNPDILLSQIKQEYMIAANDDGKMLNVFYVGDLVQKSKSNLTGFD